MLNLRVVEENAHALGEYGTIPISFSTAKRLSIDGLQRSLLDPHPIAERFKDYDCLGEAPATLPDRFNIKTWGILSAFVGDTRVGGAILAWKTEGVDMLQGREDLVIMWDLRVHPEFRGEGIATALFQAALGWARERGCSELNVETQDINVGACGFYKKMGCRVISVEADAYGPELDEAKVIWSLAL